MRLVQLLVPADRQEAVGDVLDEFDVAWLAVPEARTDRDGEHVVVYAPMPSEAIDEVRERLREAELAEDAYFLTTTVDSVVGANEDELEERFVEGIDGDVGISHSALRTRARDLRPSPRAYVVLSALSAVLAVSGLLLGSAIVIVGAMVVAPFVGSTLSASVGAVIGDRREIRESAGSQAVGLMIAVVAATLVSLLVRATGFVPSTVAVAAGEQVTLFGTPTLLAAVVAVCAGGAGALALATDLPVAVAGVAVSAALVPAAATVGIGLAWWNPLLALGALVLLTLNVSGVNVAAYLGLLALGYRPWGLDVGWRDAGVGIGVVLRGTVLVAFLALLAVAGLATYQHVTFDHAATTEVAATLEDAPYRELELLRVETTYDSLLVVDQPQTVTVVVSRDDGREYPALAARLRERIERRTGQPVAVRVRFADYQVARPSTTRVAPTTRPSAPVASGCRRTCVG